MQFRLQFDTDNAAFEGEDLGPEIARILYAIANDINQRSPGDIVEGSARDINGNRVGGWDHDITPEKWCNHDPVAIVQGTCECGAIWNPTTGKWWNETTV